jgi:hypothetical protein
VLVATDRKHHAALQAFVPALCVHPVLGKWLYLPAAADSFEPAARMLAELALSDDPRLGVEPSAGRRRTGQNAVAQAQKILKI